MGGSVRRNWWSGSLVPNDGTEQWEVWAGTGTVVLLARRCPRLARPSPPAPLPSQPRSQSTGPPNSRPNSI